MTIPIVKQALQYNEHNWMGVNELNMDRHMEEKPDSISSHASTFIYVQAHVVNVGIQVDKWWGY